MLSFFTSWRGWLSAGAAVALLAMGTYQLGKRDGGQDVRNELVKRSYEALKKRNEIDAEISGLDDRALCSELGGVYRDGNCE